MTRSVAFMDILGFKSLLDSMPLKAIAQKYESALKRVHMLNRRWDGNPKGEKYIRKHKAGDPWCYITVFSDSIILVSLDESEDSFLKLLLYARLLFIHVLDEGLPVRGGISSGELYHNPALSLTLGKALTDAYVLEGQQDWCGVAIDNTCWGHYPRIRKMVEDPAHPLNMYFLEYPIPWKDGTCTTRRILNWRFNVVHHKGTLKLLQDTRLEGAPSKWNNTMDFVKAIKKQGWLYFADGYPLPQECPTMWFGPKKPPFNHGDDL